VTVSTEAAAPRGGIRTSSTEERLTDLYSAYAGKAVRLAFLLTGDRDAAEDVCQEAFARVGAKLHGLRDRDRISSYLYRTVVNLSRGRGRLLLRDRRLHARLRPQGAAQLPDVATHDQVARALLRLPERQRAA
jgi:DNA-directed RNA polymerase specialized sigma24 family protein